jgi:hypothetical protein
METLSPSGDEENAPGFLDAFVATSISSKANGRKTKSFAFQLLRRVQSAGKVRAFSRGNGNVVLRL